ncbi:hypothetical protein E2I00_003723, partial [Balaenoptera physalus]
DDYIKSWEDNQQGDEALDTTKDPCQKVKCSRHKVCIAQGYQRAMCISRKKLEHRGKADVAAMVGWRVPLAVPPSPSPTFLFVQCKLEQQACLSSKQLTVRCDGPCPCPTEQAATSSTDGKPETCTGQDLADLGDRLRDWFQLLHENSKQNGSAGSGARPARGTGTGGSAGEEPPCLAELERIQIQEAAKKKPGVFIPSCDEDGYYRKMQCDQSGGDCWCVDQLGLELTGTRMHGSPDCDDIVGFSGDFGS